MFAGAGLSKEAKNQNRKPPPLSFELRAAIASELGESAEIPLDVLADAYLVQKGGSLALHKLLSGHFWIMSTSDCHKTISTLPWHRIYTTNFDNAIEVSQIAAGAKRSDSYTRTDSPQTLASGAIVHLNGSITATTSQTISQDIRISFRNYAETDIQDTRWASTLRQDFHLAEAIIFVGYSLYDIDITKILLADPHNKAKTFFVVEEKPARAVQLRLDPYGSLVPVGTAKFCSEINATPAVDLAATRGVYFTNFRSHASDPNRSPKSPDSRIANDFLVLGNFQPSLLADAAAFPKASPFVDRTLVGRVLELVEKKAPLILIHADLGNGKTVFAEMLDRALQRGARRTLWYEYENDDLLDDSHLLAEIERPAIFFEDLAASLEAATVVRNANREATIVGLVRTSAFELRRSEIEAALGSKAVEIDLNELDKLEGGQLVNIFDSYGLWGGRAGFSRARKLKFISADSSGELRSVLLSVLRSERITESLRKSLRELRSAQSGVYRVVLAACLMVVLNRSPRLQSVSEILKTDAFSVLRNADYEGASELVLVRQAEVVPRSSTFCRFLLRELVPDSELIKLLVEVVHRTTVHLRDKAYYRKIGHSIMRFSTIEGLLTNQDKPKKLVQFYEEIRQTQIMNRNPQFWLQYAIAQLSFKGYEMAERFFEQAYGLAEGIAGYDTYQIDNHFARFLLESRTYGTKWTDHVQAIKDAHVLIIKQMADVSTGYYPYRVATNFLTLIERRVDSLTSVEKAEVAALFRELVSEIDRKLPTLRRYKSYLLTCRESLLQALDILPE